MQVYKSVPLFCSNSISGWNFCIVTKWSLRDSRRMETSKGLCILKHISFLIVNYEGEVTAWFSGSRKKECLLSQVGHPLLARYLWINSSKSLLVEWKFSQNLLKDACQNLPRKTRNFTVQWFFKKSYFST